VAHDDETEACVSPYSPPVSVTLPPRLPPTRLGHSTQAEGVVEQYERFIVVDGVCFSPMCQWGETKRPPGIQSDTVSNRCAQYFAIRSLHKSVPPEDLELSCTKLKGAALAWKKQQPNNNKNVARSFWPGTAREVYKTLYPPAL
jgi:hypothetical protein